MAFLWSLEIGNDTLLEGIICFICTPFLQLHFFIIHYPLSFYYTHKHNCSSCMMKYLATGCNSLSTLCSTSSLCSFFILFCIFCNYGINSSCAFMTPTCIYTPVTLNLFVVKSKIHV